MKRIFIDSHSGNIIAALADEKKLLEFQTEKLNESVIVGSVFKGKVVNVLPGMQVAFVNIGLEKNGYLATGDALVGKAQIAEAVELPSVLDVKEGDDVIVQVTKDRSGTKGVKLTTHLTFAGRSLVYMPGYDFVLVSRRIEDEGLRARLTEIGNEIKPENGGLIIRTVANDLKKTGSLNKAALSEEVNYLQSVYSEILHRFDTFKAPALLYEDGNLAKRMLRDVYTPDVDEIIVSDYSLYLDAVDVALKRGGTMRDKVRYYDKAGDLFTDYGLSHEVDGMLRNKVKLTSGAYLIIDKTEALTAIDVNTGKYIGDSSLEKTVYETNIEACDEIARQLRLRNIGGIIIIDFIDMEEEAHRDAVVARLKLALKHDRSRCNVIGMTGLGLVEVTRKKTRKESYSALVQKCPYCKGDGVIFSNDYIVSKIRCALLDVFAESYNCAIIDLNGDICDYILKTGALSRDVEKIWREKRIYLVPHKTYHQEFFIVKGDNSKILDLPDKAELLY